MTYNKENDLLTDVEQMYRDVLVICSEKNNFDKLEMAKVLCVKAIGVTQHEVTIIDNHLNENHETLQRFLVTMHQSLPLVTMSLKNL